MTASQAAVLLDVKEASRSFGGLKALSEVSLHINKGELIGLIGPNGAGKTTLFNLLTGVYPPSTGSILLNHESIGGMKPYKINHICCAHLPEYPAVYGHDSIGECQNRLSPACQTFLVHLHAAAAEAFQGRGRNYTEGDGYSQNIQSRGPE